jgi:hypothetical protein
MKVKKKPIFLAYDDACYRRNSGKASVRLIANCQLNLLPIADCRLPIGLPIIAVMVSLVCLVEQENPQSAIGNGFNRQLAIISG